MKLEARAGQSGAAQSGAGLRAITLEDQFAIEPVEGPRISPDGKWVAYSVTTTSLAKDEDEQRVWMVPFAGGVISRSAGRVPEVQSVCTLR